MRQLVPRLHSSQSAERKQSSLPGSPHSRRSLFPIIPVILILPILLTSGCTSLGGFCIPGFTCEQTVKETSDIIVIDSLQALPSKVAPGSTINLVAIVSNKADINAPKDSVPVTVELYDYCSGMFSIKSNSAKADSPIKPVSGKEKEAMTFNLLREEKKQLEWVLEAGDVPVKTECDLKVRARYEYSTTSITTLHFIDYTEMQRRINEGTYSEVGSYISVGYGPIKPYIRVEGTQPIPVSANKLDTVLSFQIVNEGNGFLSTNPSSTASSPAIPKTSIIITPVDSSLSDVKSKLDECIKNDFDANIKLIKKESTRIPCQINDVSVGNVPVESTKTIKAEVQKYWYEFRDSIKVTVEPKF